MINESNNPLTKLQFDKLLEQRDLKLADMCKQVGKTNTVKQTGWSMSTVVNACEKHGVIGLPKGRPNKVVNMESPSNLPRFVNFTEILDETESLNFTEIPHERLSYDDPRMPQPPWRRNAKHNRELKPLHESLWAPQPEILPNGSAKIQLTRGYFAIVDEDMVEQLNKFSWSVKPDYRKAYASAGDREGKSFVMHKYVLGIPVGSGHTVDHKNGNGLDNRRINLRTVPPDVNQKNRHTEKVEGSRFRGVMRSNATGWSSNIKIEGKQFKCSFDTELEAALNYDALALQHKGPGAKTNKSLGLYTKEDLALITERKSTCQIQSI